MKGMQTTVDEERELHELALFAGAGGGILGGKILGWRTICAVEINPYAREILMCRQDEGHLTPFPIWDDVSTFDGIPWRGRVDVISGGFPCQDISAAGKGGGITGERSGLWKDFWRIIGEILPPLVFVENSPNLTSRGLGVVLGDLAALGYDAEWGVLGAEDAIWLEGAPVIEHERQRIWIIAARADSECKGLERFRAFSRQPKISEFGNLRPPLATSNEIEQRSADSGDGREAWWQFEPAMGRVAHGVPHRMDRLERIGNGQVPAVVALAWRILFARMTHL
jgi:DNA (cytosine-5)-methyltransferase 1